MKILNVNKLLKNKLFLIILFIILYLFLYYDFYMCDFITGDEGYQLALSNWSFSKIIYYCSIDYHVPLFAILVKCFSYLPFSEIFSSRLLLSLIIMMHFVVAFFPLERLTNRKVSLLYAVLFLLSPILLYFVMQIRMYSLANLNLFCVLIYALLAMKYNKRSDWVKLVIVSILSCYSFLLATFITFAILLFLAFCCFWKKEYHIAKKFVLCFCVVFLFFVPWIPNLLNQLFNVQSSRYWRWFPSGINFWSNIVSVFVISFVGGFCNSANVWAINVVIILLIIVACIYNHFVLKRRNINFDINISSFIVVFSFLFILFYTYVNETFAIRYFSIIYSLFLFWVTYYFCFNSNSFIKTAFLIFFVLFGINYYFSLKVISLDSINNLNILVEDIKKNIDDEKTVIYHPFESSLEIFGYKYLNNYDNLIVYDNYCEEQKNVLRDYSLFGDNFYVLDDVDDIPEHTDKFYMINVIYHVGSSSDCLFDLFDEYNWDYRFIDKYISAYNNGDVYELYEVKVNGE